MTTSILSRWLAYAAMGLIYAATLSGCNTPNPTPTPDTTRYPMTNMVDPVTGKVPTPIMPNGGAR